MILVHVGLFKPNISDFKVSIIWNDVVDWNNLNAELFVWFSYHKRLGWFAYTYYSHAASNEI